MPLRTSFDAAPRAGASSGSLRASLLKASFSQTIAIHAQHAMVTARHKVTRKRCAASRVWAVSTPRMDIRPLAEK